VLQVIVDNREVRAVICISAGPPLYRGELTMPLIGKA